MIRSAYFGLFSVTNASMPDESKMVMSALVASISWHIGSVKSTSLSNTNCMSDRKSCLNRVSFDASGTFSNPQNSRSSLE